jgi:hypothetical protein
VTSDWDRFRNLGIPSWNTSAEGPLREALLPYSTVGDYDGHPVPIRFGAFLAWTGPIALWSEIAPRLAPGVLQRAGLVYIIHQAGGHACLQLGCVGRPVELGEAALQWSTALCRDYYHAERGWFCEGTPANIAAYRGRAGSLGLTADLLDDLSAGYDLVESLYPLDAGDDNLAILLRSGLPPPLTPLLGDPELRRRMIFLLLADNSD